jgi:serine/threonine protein kinase
MSPKTAKPFVPQQFGPYTLLKRLGRGGMAEVFLARTATPGAYSGFIAVKRLLGAFNADEQLVSMLADEARLSVWLHHPAIVQVFDFAVEDSTHYIAMEYVDGCDLSRLIRDRKTRQSRPLPLATAIYASLQIAEALEYAHCRSTPDGTQMNIIHRDVSPHNVLVSREGQVKLADFGLARASISVHHSQAGVIRGKFAYMPKEQAHGQHIDQRIDLFATGVTLYECLTGKRPYTSTNLAEQLYQLEQPIPPPSAHMPDVPAEIDELTMQALSPTPDGRYQTAGEMADDLSHALAKLSTPNQEAQQLAALVRNRAPALSADLLAEIEGQHRGLLEGPAPAPRGSSLPAPQPPAMLPPAEHSLISNDVQWARRSFAPPMRRRAQRFDDELEDHTTEQRPLAFDAPVAHASAARPARPPRPNREPALVSRPPRQNARQDQRAAGRAEQLASAAAEQASAREQLGSGHPYGRRHQGPRAEHGTGTPQRAPATPSPVAQLANTVNEGQATIDLGSIHGSIVNNDVLPTMSDPDERYSTIPEDDEFDGAATLLHTPERARARVARALADAPPQPKQTPSEIPTTTLRRKDPKKRLIALLLAGVALIGVGLAGGWMLRDTVRKRRAARQNTPPAARITAKQRGSTTRPARHASPTKPLDRSGRTLDASGESKKATTDARSARRDLPKAPYSASAPKETKRRPRPAVTDDQTTKRPTHKPIRARKTHTKGVHKKTPTKRSRPQSGRKARQPKSDTPKGKGILHVTCAQGTGRVFIDDRSAGVAPVKLSMSPGIYRIKVLFSNGAFSATRFVTIDAGKTARVAF